VGIFSVGDPEEEKIRRGFQTLDAAGAEHNARTLTKENTVLRKFQLW
jgi:hypothetical protein